MLSLIPMGLLTTSCNTAGCTDNQNALPLMGFYDYVTEASISLDSIDLGGVGAPDGALLVTSGRRVSQVYLPFRDGYDRVTFCIHYDYKLQGIDDPSFDDLITFTYDTEPYFASSECGAMYRYTITGVTYTRNLIDSISVTDNVIDNIEKERIKVFFRTAQNEESDNPDNSEDDSDNPEDNSGDNPEEGDEEQ